MTTPLRRAALFAVVFVLGCGGSTGTITGTVTGTGGAPLVAASVTTDPATTSVVTDATGKYTIPDVAAGTYKVTVTSSGYTTKERAGVTVAAGATVTLDFALDAATGGVKVTVKDLCGTGNVPGATIARTGVADVTAGTDGTATLTGLTPGAYSFTVSAPAYLPATATGTVTAGATLDLDVNLTCQAKAVRDLASAYVTSLSGLQAVAFTAKSLHDTLADGDLNNDPLVLSVRAQADYEKGHVPGSLSIPYKEVADDAQLAKLSGYSATVGIKAFCYTGHTGGIATGVLNLLGYKTSNMKFGFVAWTRDATARTPSGVSPEYPATDYPTETTANVPTQTYTPPRLAFAATTALETAKLAARDYLKDASMKPTITAATLKANLDDGNATNDPFIVDVRAKADYDLAHIPGAVSLPIADLVKPGNLELIPTDRDVVVVCYTGHTGAVGTAVLGTLGYKRATNLKYGFAAWKRPATVYNDATDSNDFLFNTGTAP